MEPYVWVLRRCIEVNFKAATISVNRATLLLMCLWGPTALGNSYWLLIVWQQPTLFQSPSHLNPVLRGRIVVARLAVPWSPWVGILCTPAALSTLLILCLLATTNTPPLTPHSVTLLAKDRGLFPRCHGDVAREKCKGREGKSACGGWVGGGVCSQVCLSRHVWKRVKGERENERKEER